MRLKLFLFIMGTLASASLWAQSTDSKGITMEFSAGYPTYQIATPDLNAIYNGYSLQGGLIIPFASGASYSLDLDISYGLDSLENNRSNNLESEWAHFNTVGAGLRFRLSYFELGVSKQHMRGKHLRAGAETQIYDYKLDPLSWRAGINIPLSSNTNIGVGYSANLQSDVFAQGENLKIKSETVWIKVQIDFGITFLNLFAVEESFTSTRASFFTN